jgi:predicted DNA-binding protein (MmcQ/YjbR family)
MSKTHWNTVRVNNDLHDSVVKELIDHSLVFSLTKKIREMSKL